VGDQSNLALSGLQSAEKDGRRIHGALFVFDRSLSSIQTRLNTSRARLWGITATGEGPLALSIKKPAGRSKHISPIVDLIAWSDPELPVLWIAGTHTRRDFEFGLEVLHRFLAPDLVRIYLQTKLYAKSFAGISRRMNRGSLRVMEYVSKGLIDDSDAKRGVQTSIVHTDMAQAELFEVLSAQRKWLSSCVVVTRGGEPMSGRIMRDCTFTCDRNIAGFFGSIVQEVAKTALVAKDFYDGRSSTTSGTGLVRPLRITYARRVFEDTREAPRLIKVLDDWRESAMSLFNASPYVHAGLLDYSDGSTYDLWVASSDSVLIVPKTVATADSISSLCDHICNRFEEGEVLEA